MSVSAEFAVQMTKCQRKLHAFIVSLVWNPADADDVLQETNLVLWQKAAEFDVTVKQVLAPAMISVDEEMAKEMGFEDLETLRGAIRSEERRVGKEC